MSSARSIPSLDGLRALAVTSVVLFHCETPILSSAHWLQPFRNGALGVTCFFVLSGFLITKLLLNELDRFGKVDLWRFYFRRACRIFPPYYAYLLVVGLLCLLHLTQIDLSSFLYAVFYARNYAPHPTVELLGHVWSLCLEEQFYLVWPACLVLFRPRICLRIAALAILLSPVLRVLTYILVPSMRDHINLMLHTRLDSIMAGAFISLAQHQGTYKRLLAFFSRTAWLLPIGFYFLVQPLLESRYKGSFTLVFGDSLDSIACGVVLLCVTTVPGCWLGRLLNLKSMRHLGIISYSLYLWQQLFTGANTFFPLNLVVIFLCAECSYWLIERPSLKLRNVLLHPGNNLPDAVAREDMLISRAVR